MSSGPTRDIHPQTDPPDTRAHRQHVRTTDADKGKAGQLQTQGLKSNSPVFSPASPHQGPQIGARPTAPSLASTSVLCLPFGPTCSPNSGYLHLLAPPFSAHFRVQWRPHFQTPRSSLGSPSTYGPPLQTTRFYACTFLNSTGSQARAGLGLSWSLPHGLAFPRHSKNLD